MRGGTPPTVAEAAEAARVSRATAYRYFPTQETLLIEIAGVSAATAPVEELVNAMPPGGGTGDAQERLLRLLDACNRIMFTEEVTMRTALRAYMDTWLESRRNGVEAPVVREGRRMRWLDSTLAPARGHLSEPQWRRLRAALALTLSTEALIVMKDVCRFEDEEEALGVLAWAASALLRAGLDEAEGEPVDVARDGKGKSRNTAGGKRPTDR
jgi:AcrR family transcriptional regulator